jgi:gliding motility-associated-like protein
VNGCAGQPTSFEVSVIPCNLIIPTAFTPDGDGDNDLWEIVGLDAQFPLNQVKVYNRWGELIYTSVEGNYALTPWDGTYNDKNLPVGSYYFILEKSTDGSIEPINGTVSILREP